LLQVYQPNRRLARWERHLLAQVVRDNRRRGFVEEA
jgi:hypothetical protein